MRIITAAWISEADVVQRAEIIQALGCTVSKMVTRIKMDKQDVQVEGIICDEAEK